MIDRTSADSTCPEQSDGTVIAPEDFLLDDPAIQADPYAYYPILRDQKPVMRTTVGGQTWWVLSRQDDVAKALMDPQTFSSQTLPDASILFLDPPEHDRLRAFVAPWFSRTAIHQLAKPINDRAEALIGTVAEVGKCDIVEDIAIPLTVTMISGMLGIPAEAVQRLRDIRRFGPGFLAYLQAARIGAEPSPTAREGYDIVNAALGSVIDGEFSEDGIVADLVRHLTNGNLTRAECLSYVNILFGAGHNTTTDLIGNAVFTLTERPGDLDRMKQDGAFAAAFLEEVLRTRPSLHRIPRITTRDVEIAGKHIPAGSLVRLLLASANRDPAMYEDAEAFDPDKKRRMHLAFGRGIHTCLGNWLARLEGTIALQVMSRHVTAVNLDPDKASSSHSGGTFNNFGFKKLPVLLRARSN